MDFNLIVKYIVITMFEGNAVLWHIIGAFGSRKEVHCRRSDIRYSRARRDCGLVSYCTRIIYFRRDEYHAKITYNRTFYLYLYCAVEVSLKDSVLHSSRHVK